MKFKYPWYKKNRLIISSNNYCFKTDQFTASTEGYRNRTPGNKDMGNKVEQNQVYKRSNDVNILFGIITWLKEFRIKSLEKHQEAI